MRKIKNIKNVYTGAELKEALKNIVDTKKATTIIFHEELYGFCDYEIKIMVVYNKIEDSYDVTVGETTRSFTSKYTFQDYVWAVCGW